MIAADTSTWINFYQQKNIPEVAALKNSLESNSLVMPPPVLIELLSSVFLLEDHKIYFKLLPRLPLTEGYWERSGQLRYKLQKEKLKSRAMDCMIAQICIDHHVPLISNDSDFRHFAKHGLILIH